MGVWPITDVPFLRVTQLEELRNRWEQQGLGIVDALRPGLTDAEMDELTRPLGFTLPREARVWWGWHDGAQPDDQDRIEMLGPGRQFLSLRDSVEHSRMYRDTLWAGAERDNSLNWQLTWLPISANVTPTVIECGGPFDAPVRCRTYELEQPDMGMVGVKSLGTLVAMYIAAYDSGGWKFDAVLKRWRVDPQKLELPREQYNLL
jgi:hypothetical protein